MESEIDDCDTYKRFHFLWEKEIYYTSITARTELFEKYKAKQNIAVLLQEVIQTLIITKV